MKKQFALLLCLCVFMLMLGCSRSPAEDAPLAGQGAGLFAADLDSAFNQVLGLSTETCVVIGSVTDEVVTSRQFGDVRRMDIERVIHGDITEVYLGQMYEEQLETGRTYLLLIKLNDIGKGNPLFIDNEYNIVGAYGQCSFWIEDGQLRGRDQRLVDEILSNASARTYTADGTAIDVNTMDGLADYFTAFVDAMEDAG